MVDENEVVDRPSMTVEEEPQPEAQPATTAYEQVSVFLLKATRGGLTPLVAYSIDEDGLDEPQPEESVAPEAEPPDDDEVPDSDDDDVSELASVTAPTAAAHTIRVLTTRITELALAIRILERATPHGYNLGKRLRLQKIIALQNENPHVFSLSKQSVSGIDTDRVGAVGKIIQRFGAPFMRQKGFALLDICGFSELGHSEQLSCLYSLTSMLDSAIRRSRRFCNHLRVPCRFGRNSTGDGYYFWHHGVDGRSDVITFTALAGVMAECEAIRRNGFPMQLKSSFVIGSAFLFYDAEARKSPQAVASNAIGEATNGAARLVSACLPGQILMGDFQRPGQGNEIMDPRALLAQVNELFRDEGAGAARLILSPERKLRIADKHKKIWYCYNIHGPVPNKAAGELLRLQIGLEPDDSPSIDSTKFRSAAESPSS